MFGTPFQLQAGDVTYGSMPPPTYGPMNPMVAAAAVRQSTPEAISKEQLGYLANTLAQVSDPVINLIAVRNIFSTPSIDFS